MLKIKNQKSVTNVYLRIYIHAENVHFERNTGSKGECETFGTWEDEEFHARNSRLELESGGLEHASSFTYV